MRTCSASASASEYTATVAIPICRAVRMMRQATSPRLAVRILRNMGLKPRQETKLSQRDVVVFFPRIGERFAAQHREFPAEPPPRVARQDHVVDKAAARRDKRVGEFLAVFF